MNKKEQIVIIGGGRHARVVIDLIETLELYKIVGIVDPSLKTNKKIFNIDILGDDSQLEALLEKGVRTAALGIGSWGDNTLRGDVYKRVSGLGFTFRTLIHSQAYISKYAQLSQGVQVMAGACIQPGAVIGENCVINTGAIVEHDCHLGRDVYIGPRAVLSGNVTVKDSTFIGSGACVVPEVAVGAQCLVAAGAVVIKNVNDNERVKGIPARSF